MIPGREQAGLSLVELLVAVALMLVSAGAIFGLTYPAHVVFEAEPERADMQQRLRIAAESISKDLMMAGRGGEQAGSMVTPGLTFAAIQPLRRGLRSPDLSGSFFDDRISIMYVPHAAAVTTLNQPTASTTLVEVAPQRGCPLSNPLCGFRVSRLISVYDDTGAYDTFRLLAIQADPPALIGDGSPLSKTYGEGATVAEMTAATYWLKSDDRANVHQLMRYDGQQTDSPVADHVIGLRFEYFGEPRPPAIIRPLEDARGPWTSYGPKPPEVDFEDVFTPGYGPGENCMFAVDDRHTVARPDLIDLGSATSELVPLDPSRFVDGPWCPDAGSPVRFDADLLRIRRVRVALRVTPARRLLLTRIPDIAVHIEVGVRNLER